MKKLLIFLFLILFLIPINVFAISDNYIDKVAPIANIENDERKINLYLFYGQECPHCEEERKWLDSIKNDYSDELNIIYFEVWHNEDNNVLIEKVKKELGVTKNGVPLTIVGDKYFVGFSSGIGSRIESTIKDYLEIEHDSNIINIPILGNVNVKDVSIPVVAIILGFIDGFNPCAMWILLFLISMLFSMKDKKKAWILGLTFLFVSGFVYFLSMIGINFILDIATISYLKLLIALFILAAGILNLKKYIEIRKKESGCTVVDDKKRKKIITKTKKIVNNKNFFLSIVGIIVLASAVNLIELACSLGFPLIFTEILSINDIHGLEKILYLLIYIFFYMIDDIVVFSISMITVEITGITNKYSKLCTLISAIIMIIIGILLILKPDWLMFNF